MKHVYGSCGWLPCGGLSVALGQFTLKGTAELDMSAYQGKEGKTVGTVRNVDALFPFPAFSSGCFDIDAFAKGIQRGAIRREVLTRVMRETHSKSAFGISPRRSSC